MSQCTRFYFGANNGAHPDLRHDANAFFGKAYASPRARVPSLQHPMQSALDYVWAGSQVGSWDPLAAYNGYPTAPYLDPTREAQALRTVSMRDGLGYQMVMLRDNGVPIAGLPGSTPDLVKGGPIQIGYMSATQAVLDRSQLGVGWGGAPPMPNPAPRTRKQAQRQMRQHNPGRAVFPTVLNIMEAKRQQGYGAQAGSPHAWPCQTQPHGFQTVGQDVGCEPVYGYQVVGPPPPTPRQDLSLPRVDTNPHPTAQPRGSRGSGRRTYRARVRAHNPPGVVANALANAAQAVGTALSNLNLPLLGAGLGAGAAAGGVEHWRATRSSNQRSQR